MGPHGEPCRGVGLFEASGNTCVELRSVVDQRAQRPQPGFVAAPAGDGGAIDLLASLPLAGGLYRARIGFGAEAGVVPRQAAGCDDPPDGRFGRASRVLVIDLNEAIRRQHAAPMVNEPLVAAKMRDQFSAAGNARDGWK